MEASYRVPAGNCPDLALGEWVEIFEAYGNGENPGIIDVTSMRVSGNRLNFGGKGKQTTKPLRPHEGKVVAFERSRDGIRFHIRLRP